MKRLHRALLVKVSTLAQPSRDPRASQVHAPTLIERHSMSSSSYEASGTDSERSARVLSGSVSLVSLLFELVDRRGLKN